MHVYIKFQHCASSLKFAGCFTAFKIFVWMQLLDTSNPKSNFADFHLPLNIKVKIKKIADLIAGFKTIEIWNDTTVSSSLKQIRYFYEFQSV